LEMFIWRTRPLFKTKLREIVLVWNLAQCLSYGKQYVNWSKRLFQRKATEEGMILLKKWRGVMETFNRGKVIHLTILKTL
jgi:hypothetical protein